jgi:2-haloacid dehalogenase
VKGETNFAGVHCRSLVFIVVRCLAMSMNEFKITGIRGFVFDAYGTLFDVSSAARQAQETLGDTWRELAELWRAKQLQYTWLRSLAGRHVDFWQLTGDALDFALDNFKLKDREQLREQLMDLYLRLSAYPEVREVLGRLKAAGVKCAILSNGSPEMLSAAIENARIQDLLDATLSVEEVHVYKPHPSVYQLAVDRLGLRVNELCFVSSNGWDAYSAKAFGFHVIWCNRFRQVPERIPETPDAEVRTLSDLPALAQIADSGAPDGAMSNDR